MFEFSTDKGWHKRLGLGLVLAELCVFILALPPFQLGIWYQTEPILFGLLAISVFNCLWLGLGFYKNFLVCRSWHPLFLCFLLWIAWQCLATLNATSSWRSWFGPAEVGDGTAQNIALLLCFMVAYPLWQIEKFRNLIIKIAAANIMILCALHFFNDPSHLVYINGDWKTEKPGKLQPANWQDYLGYMVGYFWVFAVLSRAKFSAKLHVALIIIIFIALYFSNNQASRLFLYGSAILICFILWFRERGKMQRFFYPGKNWRYLAITVCMFTIGWTLLGLLISPFTKTEDSNLAGYTISQSSSTGIRTAFNLMGIEAIKQEPKRLLMGDGWSRFSDDMFKYLFLDGARIYNDGVYIEDKKNPENSFYTTYHNAFHPHNQLIENLLALGIPGMLLWLLMPVIIIFSLPKRFFWQCAPMVVGITLINALWFQLPQVMSYQALFLVAIISTAAKKPLMLNETHLRSLSLLSLCLAGLMTWSAFSQYQAMAYGSTVGPAVIAAQVDPLSANIFASDIKRGGDRFRETAEYAVSDMMFRARKGKITPEDGILFDNLLTAAHQAALTPGIGARTNSLELWMLNILYSTSLIEKLDPSGTELRAKTRDLFIPAVLRLAEKAPQREDLSAAFLLALDNYTKGDGMAQVDIFDQVLKVNPDHRIALWKLGRFLAYDDNTKEVGLEMRRRAAALGVDRIAPIKNEEIEGLE